MYKYMNIPKLQLLTELSRQHAIKVLKDDKIFHHDVSVGSFSTTSIKPTNCATLLSFCYEFVYKSIDFTILLMIDKRLTPVFSENNVN